MSENELSKKEETLPALSPADAADQAAMFGDFEREDLTIPRLVLLQSTSPQVDDGLGKPGEFFVTGINRNLGAGPLELIPLMRSKSRAYWKKLDEGGGKMCEAKDAKHGVGSPGGDCESCPAQRWHGNDKPLCDLNENLVAVVRTDEDWMPLAVTGKRSTLRAMKDLNMLLTMEIPKHRPIYAKSYLMRVVPKNIPNTQKKYYTFAFTQGNQNAVLPEAEQARAAVLFQRFKTARIAAGNNPDEETPKTEVPF